MTTVLIAVLLLGGIQLITVGLIGEYLGRVYEEVKDGPCTSSRNDDRPRTSGRPEPVSSEGGRRDGAPHARVAVIGAGMTGLAAAHRLAEGGAAVDVYERWPGLGGMVATVDVGAPQPPGALLPPPLRQRPPYRRPLRRSSGWAATSSGTRRRSASSPTAPRYPVRLAARPAALPAPVARIARLRLGLGCAAASCGSDRPRSSTRPHEEWITQINGRGELGEGSGARSCAGSSAIAPTTSRWRGSGPSSRCAGRLGGQGGAPGATRLPAGGWQPLLERLRDEVERAWRAGADRPPGGRARPVPDGLRVRAGGVGLVADAVTTPRAFPSRRRGRATTTRSSRRCPTTSSPGSSRTASCASGLGERLPRPPRRRSSTHTALCLLWRSIAAFTPYYWLNVADQDIPFIGLDRAHEPRRARRAMGESTSSTSPTTWNATTRCWSSDVDELVDAYEPGLRRVNPAFSRELDKARASSSGSPRQQPVVDRRTSASGSRRWRPGSRASYLANTTQIYPEDRGTNYSVELGEKVAAAVLAGEPVPA